MEIPDDGVAPPRSEDADGQGEIIENVSVFASNNRHMQISNRGMNFIALASTSRARAVTTVSHQIPLQFWRSYA